MEMEKNKKNRYGFDFTPMGLDNGIHLDHRVTYRRPRCENHATVSRDFVQITAFHKEVGAFLGFGLGDAAHVPHLGKAPYGSKVSGQAA